MKVVVVRIAFSKRGLAAKSNVRIRTFEFEFEFKL